MYAVIVVSLPIVAVWLLIGLIAETIVLAILGYLLRSTIQRVSLLEQAQEGSKDAAETSNPI